MYGLRNRIVHDYEGENLRLVWEIISEDIPELRDTLGKIIKQQVAPKRIGTACFQITPAGWSCPGSRAAHRHIHIVSRICPRPPRSS